MSLTDQTHALRAALVAELPDGDVKATCARLCEEILANLRLLESETEIIEAAALAAADGGDFAMLQPVEQKAWVGVARAKKAARLEADAETEREAEAVRAAEALRERALEPKQ